jgi:predicted lactoylglutathione lyase
MKRARKFQMEPSMNDEALNMSIRKFLKTVGVNSQLAIEKAVRKALEDGALKGNETLPAQMTLTVGTLDLNVKFDGELRLD